MTHRVVVFRAMVAVDDEAELRTGVIGPHEKAAVAVCFDCDWRGGVWGSAQTAVDDANQHRAVTR